MDSEQIIKYRKDRNDLSRKRMRTNQGTTEYRSLTVRIENLDKYIEIAKKINSEEIPR